MATVNITTMTNKRTVDADTEAPFDDAEKVVPLPARCDDGCKTEEQANVNREEMKQ